MTNRLLNSLDRLRRDERGYSLPDVMVGVVASGIALSLIAGALASFTTLLTDMKNDSALFATNTTVDTRWRSDTQRAVHIAVPDSTTVEFTLTPGLDRCTTETWSLNPAQETLTIRQTTFKEATVTDGKCVGTKTGSTAEDVLTGVDLPASSFTFTNTAGRELTFTDGVATPADGEQPAGVSDSRWGSTTIRFTNLTVEHNSDDPVLLNITHTATQIPDLAGSPSAPTTYHAP